MNEELETYKKYVAKRLSALTPIFAKASVGDFSEALELPEEDDEFTELYAGVGIMLDVIKDKIRKLDEDRKELSVLLDNLPVGVYIAEVPSGKPILSNRRAKELVGRDIDPEAGVEDYANIYNVVKEDDGPYPSHEQPVQMTINTGLPAKKDDIIIKHKDGEIVLKVQTVPVFSEDQEMLSVIAVFDDITKEKELDRMKSDFISVAAHQLRSPLSVMRWNMELFLKHIDQTSIKDRAKLDSIYKNTLKMIKLVDDMLSVTKLDDEKATLIIEPIDLNELIKSVMAAVSEVALQKQVKLIYDKTKDGLKILADKSQSHEVFFNLVDNAIKYTPPLGTVGIKTTSEDGIVMVEISDTGIGIPYKDTKYIFDKFYRATNVVQMNSSGTGLGLYVVKTFVESWGGAVWFDSPVNTDFRSKVAPFDTPGTSFYLRLKAAGGDSL